MKVSIRDDYSGSGRVTQVVVDDYIVVWTWAWHIDGPPDRDAISLLNALGWHSEPRWTAERKVGSLPISDEMEHLAFEMFKQIANTGHANINHNGMAAHICFKDQCDGNA